MLKLLLAVIMATSSGFLRRLLPTNTGATCITFSASSRTNARRLLNLCVTSRDYQTYRASFEDVDGIERTMHYIDIGQSFNNTPPLVILAGTAQTIATFGPHIRPISRTRRLIIAELRGQGETELLSHHGTIDQHVKDFENLMKMLCIDRVDLAGFSFGGRIGLAIAKSNPTLVAKLSITGVPLVRPPLGRSILESWKEGLKEGHMSSCAWSFILNGYSAKFIEKYETKLPMFVNMVMKSNDAKKLYDLLVYSHIPNEEYSVPVCVAAIQCPTQIIGTVHS